MGEARTSRSPAAFPFLALLLSVAPVSAAAGGDSAVLVTEEAPLLWGDAVAMSTDALLLLGAGVEGRSPAGPIGWTVMTAHVTVVHATGRIVAGPSGPTFSLDPDWESEETNVSGAAFEFSPRGPEAAVVVRTRVGGTASIAAADLREAALVVQSAPERYWYGQETESGAFYSTRSGPDGVVVEPSAHPYDWGSSFVAHVEGKATVFVTGGRLRADDTEGGHLDAELGFRRDAVSPVGGVHEDRYSFAVVRATGVQLAASAAPGDAARLVLGRAIVDVHGAAAFDAATGTIRSSGASARARGETVRIDGDFRLAVLGAGAAAGDLSDAVAPRAARRFSVAGDFERLAIGGRVIDVAPPGPGEVVAASAALSLTAAVLSRAGRAFLASGAAALYTRLAGADVTDSRERRALLDRVHAQPGVHLRELQRLSEFGWGKFHYHLHVLARSRLVRLDRRARHVHVYAVREAPRVEALLSVRGAAAQIYRAVPTDAEVSQSDLQRSLGYSPQLISYHLRSLVRDGLVEIVGGRPKRYRRSPLGPGGEAPAA